MRLFWAGVHVVEVGVCEFVFWSESLEVSGAVVFGVYVFESAHYHDSVAFVDWWFGCFELCFCVFSESVYRFDCCVGVEFCFVFSSADDFAYGVVAEGKEFGVGLGVD